MKRIIIILFVFSVFASTSAQSYTQSFNEVFQHVDLSHTSTGILYERVLPFSNLVSYVTNISHPEDTCDYWQFVMAYDELYRAGARNTFLSNSLEGVLRNLPVDTSSVVLGILHANFNTFDTAAMRQRLYFDADSVLWENTSVNVSLFNENNVYMVSPLVEQIATRTIQFILDGRFFFSNTTNPIVSLMIDFGDGYGERAVTMNTFINITYPSEGTKVLQIKSTFYDGSTVASFAKLKIGRNSRGGGPGTSSHPYTEDMTVTSVIRPYNPYTGNYFDTIQGDIRIYYACSDMILRKPVLIVDGFDPVNDRRFDTCYAKGEKSLWDKLGDGLDEGYNVGDMLLALGYDIVLLDLPNGGTYIEENAMVCIAAINKINEILQQSGSDEQIVVVGPSMGGQITRYALAYMEQNSNANTNYGNHNCRLWISFDSPHQGANISIGVQKLVENYNLFLTKLWDSTLCSIAAKQMLVYHKQNGADSYFNTYYQQIVDMDYPNSARKIAISNGSLNKINNGVAGNLALLMSLNVPFFQYTLLFSIRNMAEQGQEYVFRLDRLFGELFSIPVTWAFPNNGGRGSLDVAPGCKYPTFDKIANNDFMSFLQNIGVVNVFLNQHTHCFMPITSVLDISDPLPYATDVSNRDLVAERKMPFDSYWGPLDKNMEHISFDNDLVGYLLNEIETYIQGPRDVQLCTRPTYSLHLPQDSTATVTWTCSENVRIVPTNNPYVVTIVPQFMGNAWVCVEVSTLKHKKTLAHFPIHISNNVNNTPVLVSLPNQGPTITVNNEVYLTSKIIQVDSGEIMTVTGTIHCSPGTRIIVRPGGKLVVDGGTITSACSGEMWQGIEVVGNPDKRQIPQWQGVVELKNGATIKNAHCAIRTGLQGDSVYFTTGGIIQADSAFFINNRRSVEFMSYTNHSPAGNVMNNQSYFYRCVFTVDDDNLFGQDNGSFIDHVTMWAVRGVKFRGCDFRNLTTTSGDRRHAIYTDNAGFSVDDYCGANIYVGCECFGYSKSSTFSGFTTAVEVNTSGHQHSVDVNRAQFANNGTGVRVNGNNYVTVTRCDFDLQNATTHNIYGLYLNACTGYLVEGNTFHRTSAPSGNFVCKGVEVANSGHQSNLLHLNEFTFLSHGVFSTGNNSGLQLTCCSFQSNINGIYASGVNSISTSQGAPANGADNYFRDNVISDFYYSGTPSVVSYYYSVGSGHALTNYYGVTPLLAKNANTCASTLCDDSSQPLLAGFQSDMNAYATALANQSPADGTDGGTVETQHFASLQTMRQTLSETYYTAVRTLMADTVLDLSELGQWHTAAQPIADPYSLTETRFMEGYAEPFVADADDAELSNYADFHAMKLALRGQYDNTDNQDNNNINLSNSQNSPTINWYALTPAQIAQLQVIAERNAGRASVMAKGVLCFFFGICYDDDLSVDDNADNQDNNSDAENRSAKAPQQGGETYLNVYPNPTDDVLYVELSGTGIKSVGLYDLQGRIVADAANAGGRPAVTLNVRNVPAGVYVLRVTDINGREYHQKVVVR